MSNLRHQEKEAKKLQDLPIVDKKIENEKEEKFLREICEYEFYNLETPGLCLRFTYGSTNNNHTLTLFHGAKYKMPRFIAQHIESKGTPIWEWRPDGTGRLSKNNIGRKPRFRMSQVFA